MKFTSEYLKPEELQESLIQGIALDKLVEKLTSTDDEPEKNLLAMQIIYLSEDYIDSTLKLPELLDKCCREFDDEETVYLFENAIIASVNKIIQNPHTGSHELLALLRRTQAGSKAEELLAEALIKHPDSTVQQLRSGYDGSIVLGDSFISAIKLKEQVGKVRGQVESVSN